jgi:hypothetical protein
LLYYSVVQHAVGQDVLRYGVQNAGVPVHANWSLIGRSR